MLDATFRSAHLLVLETNATPSGLEPLIGIEELAEHLGVPIKTLYKWRQEGTGPCSVRVGRHVRYFVGDVRDRLSSTKITKGRYIQPDERVDPVTASILDTGPAEGDAHDAVRARGSRRRPSGRHSLPVRNEVHYDSRVFVRVDWSKRGEYMQRKHGITPQVADDALGDPSRIVIDPDYNSTSGESIRIIGFSTIADDIVTVIVLQHEGTEYGVNGWSANEKDRRIYNEGSYAGEEGEAP